MNTLKDDTTANQELIGLVTLIVAVASVSGVMYVAGQERVEQEAAPDATIEQSSIEAQSASQLEIKPLVGNDVTQNEVKVRIRFLDRPADPAVITNLEQASASSTGVQTTTTRTVQTGNVTPITRNITTYTQTGTTNEVELPVYNWSKDIEVEKYLIAWKVYDDGDHSNHQVVHRTDKPDEWDNASPLGGIKTYEYQFRNSDRVTERRGHSISAARPDGAYYTGESSSYIIETVTETVYMEAPVQPADGWTKVYRWEKPTETKQISKYQYWGCYCPGQDKTQWFERGADGFNKYLDDDGEPLYTRSKYNVKYETVTTTETVTSATKPGPDWEQAGPVELGRQTYELNESVPVYEARTREVVVGYNVTNTTQTVEHEQTVYVHQNAVDDGDRDDADPGDVLNASVDAQFLGGPAVGVGGTVGTDSSGAWTLNVWFNSDTLSGLHNFVSDADASTNHGFGYLCTYDDGGNITPRLAFWDNNPGTWRFANTALSTNAWYMATFAYNGSGTIDFYLDAAPDGSGALGTSYDTAELAAIGRRETDTSRYFDGSLAEVMVFDHRLAPSTIQYLHDVVRGRGHWVSEVKQL